MRNRKLALKAINHLFIGGIVGFKDRYIFLDTEDNLKILVKTKGNVLGDNILSKEKVKNIIGFYEEGYSYKLLNYNGLTIKGFIIVIEKELKESIILI